MGLPVDLFLDRVDPTLHCPLCHAVLDHPTSLQCGHLFCRPCLLSYQDHASGGGSSARKASPVRFSFQGVSIVCPTCRHIAVIDGDASPLSTSHSVVQSIIETLRIKCRNQCQREEELHDAVGGTADPAFVHGCNWRGTLGDYPAHAATQCPLELIACPAPGCHARVRRGLARGAGYCTKPECARAIARKYTAGAASTAVPTQTSTRRARHDAADADSDIGHDKENANDNAKPTGGSSAAKGGSLLTQRTAQLCLEADRILSKPLPAEKQYTTPPPKPPVRRQVHDDDTLVSPRPWAAKIQSAAKKKEAEADDATKKTPTSDPCPDAAKKDTDNHSAFVMAAVKIMVEKEMAKLSRLRTLAVDNGRRIGASGSSLPAMFVHRHLMDFCRSWMRRKPEALHEFAIYRPKTGRTSSLLCGIPGPKRTRWDGGLYPLLMEWNDLDAPPTCKFPKHFHHANVRPSGVVSLSTLKDGWHPELTIPELLFDVQQLLAHPNHDEPAQPEARESHRNGTYDYKTRIQTSLYVPTSLLERAREIDGLGTASSWQLVDDEALSGRPGVPNPRRSRPQEPKLASSDREACKCSCCAWGQTLWDSKREMRYLFGKGGS